MSYFRMPIYRAKEYIQREHSQPVTIVDWHRFKVNNCDVLIVIGRYVQELPDADLEDTTQFRLAVFVNGRPRLGDYIDD